MWDLLRHFSWNYCKQSSCIIFGEGTFVGKYMCSLSWSMASNYISFNNNNKYLSPWSFLYIPRQHIHSLTTKSIYSWSWETRNGRTDWWAVFKPRCGSCFRGDTTSLYVWELWVGGEVAAFFPGRDLLSLKIQGKLGY